MSKIKLGEHIRIIPGFPFNSALFNNDGDGMPLIRIRDLLASKIETYYKGEFSKEYLIEEGDILIGMDGDFHIVKWRNKTKALLNQRIMKVAQKEGAKINIEYFYYFLFPFLSDVWEKTTATTVKHLSTYDVSEAEVEFPAFEVQQRIAKILSTADAVIEKTQSAIAKYKAIKQGMLQDLFTRGIDLTTNQLRPRYEDAPELYKESKLGMIPREWDERILDDITHQIVDGTHFTPTYTDFGIPFLRVTDVQVNRIDLSQVKFISEDEHLELIKRCKPEKGDILYSKNGTIGIPKIIDWDWDFSIFVSLCLIKPKREIIEPKYLEILLSQNVILKQIQIRAKQGTVTNLHLEEIREFVIPLPDPTEQVEIKKRVLAINNKLQTEQTYLQKMQLLKKGLMEDLLSGKKQVPVRNGTAGKTAAGYAIT